VPADDDETLSAQDCVILFCAATGHTEVRIPAPAMQPRTQPLRSDARDGEGGIRDEFALNPSALARPIQLGFHLVEPECCTSTTL